MKNSLIEVATKNVTDILRLSIEHSPQQKALVVYDTHYGLTDILVAAYRAALPDAQYIDFDTVAPEEIIAVFNGMKPNDLVILIQSSNFRLDAFRIRLYLFAKKLKVIEHMHLYRNTPDVWDVYVDSLAYDIDWYRGVGSTLQKILAVSNELRIQSSDCELVVTGGLEPPKPNLGDYSGMENIGGTFPIGEVFTESKNFSKMNGTATIYAFAGADFTVNMHTPFRIDIQRGLVVGWADNAPASFINIVTAIKEYERPLIREIGFGLNRAITRQRYVQDITAFERILGMHLSLGEKHSVYKKAGMATNKTKFHVDLFPVVERVLADGVVIFENGAYCNPSAHVRMEVTNIKINQCAQHRGKKTPYRDKCSEEK